jgi:phage gpG-like protein
MIEITAEDAEVRREFARLRERTADLRPALAEIGRALANIAEDAFASETDPFGAPWDALSPEYVERPRDQGGRGGDEHPILQRDGLLAGSLSHGSDADSAWVSLGRIYAARATLGDEDAGIPRRLVLPVDPDTGALAPVAQAEVLDVLADWLGPT